MTTTVQVLIAFPIDNASLILGKIFQLISSCSAGVLAPTAPFRGLLSLLGSDGPLWGPMASNSTEIELPSLSKCYFVPNMFKAT